MFGSGREHMSEKTTSTGHSHRAEAVGTARRRRGRTPAQTKDNYERGRHERRRVLRFQETDDGHRPPSRGTPRPLGVKPRQERAKRYRGERSTIAPPDQGRRRRNQRLSGEAAARTGSASSYRKALMT